MNAWNDFNDAEQQQSFDVIPKGTVAKVRMTIKPGGYDDPSQNWDGGYATQSYETGSIYLACEFVVLEGEYARRKIWTNVGLHSSKGVTWAKMGRTFLRAALNSARGVNPNDNSPRAAAARRIQSMHELYGLEFVVRIDVEKDSRDEPRNVVKMAVEPGQPEYARLMNGEAGLATHQGGGTHTAHPIHPAESVTPPTASAPGSGPKSAVSGKPSWAQ